MLPVDTTQQYMYDRQRCWWRLFLGLVMISGCTWPLCTRLQQWVFYLHSVRAITLFCCSWLEILVTLNLFWFWSLVFDRVVYVREREEVGRKLRISKEAITLSVSLVSTTFSVSPSLPPYVIQINSLHTHTHAHIHARIHARIHIHTRARTHTHTHAHIHARIHARIHIHTRARTHTHTHTHTHTRTHNHTLTWTNGVLRVEYKPWGYLVEIRT